MSLPLARPWVRDDQPNSFDKPTLTKSYYRTVMIGRDRSFGRLRNTVVLPPGWYLTALDAPATSTTPSAGRVSIYAVNPRNDEVRVYLRARKRP